MTSDKHRLSITGEYPGDLKIFSCSDCEYTIAALVKGGVLDESSMVWINHGEPGASHSLMFLPDEYPELSGVADIED